MGYRPKKTFQNQATIYLWYRATSATPYSLSHEVNMGELGSKPLSHKEILAIYRNGKVIAPLVPPEKRIKERDRKRWL